MTKELHINEDATDVVMGVTDEERYGVASNATEELPASKVDTAVSEFEESLSAVETALLTELPTQINEA